MYNHQAHDYESTSYENKDVASVQVRITKTASTQLEALILIRAELERKITSIVLYEYLEKSNQTIESCLSLEKPN